MNTGTPLPRATAIASLIRPVAPASVRRAAAGDRAQRVDHVDGVVDGEPRVTAIAITV